MDLCGYVRKRVVQDCSSTSNTSNTMKYDNERLPERSKIQNNSDNDEIKLQSSRNTTLDYRGRINRDHIECFDQVPDQIRNLLSIQNKMKSELDQYRSDIEKLKRQLIQ